MSDAYSQDTILTVFLGRGLTSEGIRQTLEDFAETGLVRNLVWIDADSFHESSSEVTHLATNHEGLPELQRRPFNELVSRSRTTKLHLGVINVIDGTEGMLHAEELNPLVGIIDSVCSHHQIHRSNVMIGAVGAPLDKDLPILRGYVNLMLAPEDSQSPGTATVTYRHGFNDHRFTLHCVANIASLYGLWEGSTSAPIEQLVPAKGSSFRLVRSFYRRIDGQAVQARLKEKILSTAENPLPRLDVPGKERTAQYAENPDTFAQKAAREILDEFRTPLIGEEIVAHVEKTKMISGSAAVRQFFSTWLKKMVTTPNRFFAEFSAESKTLAEDALQASIYGNSGSATRVGDRVTATALDGKTHQKAVQTEDLKIRYAADLQDLWQAYANTAMSLLDAQPRLIAHGENGFRTPAVVHTGQSQRVVVARRSADVIPGPETNYGDGLPVEVKVAVDVEEVPPYDLEGVAEFERRLAKESDRGQRGMGQVIGEFKRWQDQNSKSFAYFVGSGLQDLKRDMEAQEIQWRREVSRLSQQGKSYAGTGLGSRIFRWLGWVSFWSAAIFGVWWAAEYYLAETSAEISRWATSFAATDQAFKWKFFGIWFGIWLFCWIAQCVCEARDEIRFTHLRKNLVTELDAAKKNVEISELAQLRIEVGYQQFLSISKIMGSLLERPFGNIERARRESPIPINSMPDSVIFAEAIPDSDAVEKLTRQFRRDLYKQGWMSTSVMAALDDASDALAAETGNSINPNTLFGSTGEGSYGDLARLSEYLSGDQYRQIDRSVQIWDDITTKLSQESLEVRSGILNSLQIYRAGKKVDAPYQQPLKDLVHVGFFNGEIASEKGRVKGILSLDPSLCMYQPQENESDAIGISEVLLQISEPAEDSDISFIRPQHTTFDPTLFDRMPTNEDFRPENPVDSPFFDRGNHSPHRPELPGTGEF
ncbi:hypothetical protein N24_2816 [Corynebacterium suranareeae]|uniref:Uncharacterized protein n=1 Tax=Corynebacterium suranareeae TaxID=2506452 RepID=A0A169S3L4_9CORY|nr:hypothetical protein [Corynebacterium suranareeae]BAU97078.1 hypothetical protein N24_2816 [Corynebacterium suranareeae]